MCVRSLLKSAYYINLEIELIKGNTSSYTVKHLSELQQARVEIENIIERIPEAKYRYILREHYICHKTLEDIGDSLFYSARHIRRLHKNALEAAERYAQKTL